MDVWSILIIIAGVLVVVGLAALLGRLVPVVGGVVELISQWTIALLQHIMAFFRQAVQIVIDGLPRPFKIILFVALFAVIGALAYEVTIGAPYVCRSDGQVVKVGYLEGITYKILPSKFERAEDKLANELLNISSPYDVKTLEVLNGSELIIGPYEEVWLGKPYDVYAALMPRSEEITLWGSSDFFRANDADIWRTWFGGSDRINYQVCSDPVTKTCVLFRSTRSSGAVTSCYDFSLSSGQFASIWNSPVATIRYYSDDKGSLKGDFRLDIWQLQRLQVRLGLNSMSPSQMCRPVESNVLNDLLYDDNGLLKTDSVSINYNNVLNSVFSPAKTITLMDKDAFGGLTPYTITVYSADHVPVFKSETGIVQSNAIIAYRDGASVGDTRTCLEGSTSDLCSSEVLLSGATIPTFNPAFKVVCNDESDVSYDTKPLLLGIDILNWKIMALFVLLGSLISLYLWMKKF
jgi:hypothetical protein